VGAQSLLDMVDELDVGGLVQILHPQEFSTVSTPVSVRATVLAFSSTMKSPVAVASISWSLPLVMVAARFRRG